MSIKYYILFLSLGLFACTHSDKDESAPNIIMIVADDLGYSDLSCYGSPLMETPNIDGLAAQGVRFTQGYAAACLCSPTRASIQSGLNPARINLTVHIHGNPPTPPSQPLITPPTAQYLDTALTTLPKVLKAAGYHTAHIGKWHLGGGMYSPQYHGYDMAYGGSWAALPGSFFYPFWGGKAYPELKEDAKEGDYLTDVLTNRALKYIKDHRDSTFFLGLNFYSVHVPIEAKEAKVKKYQKKADSLGITLPNAHYAAMVESIDDNVGRIIQLVSDLGLDDNTLIVFTSDNGGLHVPSTPAFIKHTPPTVNTPLRKGKGTIYEGGVREPFIFKWTGKISPSENSTQLISTVDLLNTFCAVAGNSYRTNDGIDLSKVLFENQEIERPIYVHFPHYSHQGGFPGTSIRKKDYKLIYRYEDDSFELYNLKDDPSESTNIAADKSEIVQELYNEMRDWKSSIGAKELVPNPNYKK